MFLPGESQGWQSLVGCRLWGHTESDTTEVTAATGVRWCFIVVWSAFPWWLQFSDVDLLAIWMSPLGKKCLFKILCPCFNFFVFIEKLSLPSVNIHVRFLLKRMLILYMSRLLCLNFFECRNLTSLSLCSYVYTAKSLQSCPTLCDPIDGSPPGSPVPGILQVRTLEWVAISFSNAWKWKVKVKSLSRVQLLATPWTAAYQAPPSMGFSRQEYWSGVPLGAYIISAFILWIYLGWMKKWIIKYLKHFENCFWMTFSDCIDTLLCLTLLGGERKKKVVHWLMNCSFIKNNHFTKKAIAMWGDRSVN